MGFGDSSVCSVSWYKLIRHKFKGCGLKRINLVEENIPGEKYKEIRVKFLGLKNDGFSSNSVLQKGILHNEGIFIGPGEGTINWTSVAHTFDSPYVLGLRTRK